MSTGAEVAHVKRLKATPSHMHKVIESLLSLKAGGQAPLPKYKINGTMFST